MSIMKNAVEMKTKTLCFTFDLLNHLCICLVYQSNLTFNHFLFFEFLENIACVFSIWYSQKQPEKQRHHIQINTVALAVINK